MDTPTAEATPVQYRYIVYIGKRYYKDKLVESFYECSLDGLPLDRARNEIMADDEIHGFYPKPNKSLQWAAIGSVYKQESTNGGNAWRTPQASCGKCFSQEFTAHWVIRDRSHKAVAERIKMQASDKYAATKSALSGLDYFRAEYARAMPQRKVALLADVITYITGRG